MARWKRESLGGNVRGYVLEREHHDDAVVRKDGREWIAGCGDDEQTFGTLALAKTWAETTQQSAEHTH